MALPEIYETPNLSNKLQTAVASGGSTSDTRMCAQTAHGLWRSAFPTKDTTNRWSETPDLSNKNSARPPLYIPYHGFCITIRWLDLSKEEEERRHKVADYSVVWVSGFRIIVLIPLLLILYIIINCYEKGVLITRIVIVKISYQLRLDALKS